MPRTSRVSHCGHAHSRGMQAQFWSLLPAEELGFSASLNLPASLQAIDIILLESFLRAKKQIDTLLIVLENVIKSMCGEQTHSFLRLFCILEANTAQDTKL